MSTASPVVETVSRRRTIPPSELQTERPERKTPEFWEFIENMTPDMWASDYLLYILREDPKPSLYGGTNTLEKCPGYIAMTDGTKQPLTSREDIELAIKQKYGGKAFRLILKRGSERIAEGKCMNEAPVRTPDVMGYPVHPLPNGQPTANDASVASKAIDAMASQQPDAVRLAMEVLRSASDIVMRQAQPNPNPPPPSTNSLIDQTIIHTLIEKALQPPPAPPDPFAMFLRFKEIMAPPAANGVKETLDLVSTLRTSGLLPTASGKTNLLDLGREVIPLVATTARDAIHEWRMGVEAQVRGVELSRGINPPPQPQPMSQHIPPTAPTQPPQPDTAPPISVQQSASDPPFDWLAMKIVEILKESTYTIDETVDETLSFLYRAHPAIVPLLLDPPKLNAQLPVGEQGLLLLFQHHPILKQIPVNPRLAEFIRKFVAEAKAAELEHTPGSAPVPAAAATDKA